MIPNQSWLIQSQQQKNAWRFGELDIISLGGGGLQRLTRTDVEWIIVGHSKKVER